MNYTDCSHQWLITVTYYDTFLLAENHLQLTQPPHCV